MWDRIEIWARQIRYGFFILTIGVFIATYWSAFRDNKPLMYLFLVSGFLWMLSIAYVDIREAARFARGMRKQTPLERSNRRQGRNKIMRWLRIHAFGVGITIVFGAATALYFIPFNTPKPWWGAVLAVIGPLVMWLTRRVELKGRDNENLIRQLEPLIKDTGDLEFTIRGFARDLLSNLDVKNELGSFGVQGWTYYIERLGDQQISALNSLKKELKDTDPFEELHVQDVVMSFNQILGRVLEVESRLPSNLCQKITTIPSEVQGRWEYIQQTHLRLGTQLSSLKPILNKKGQEDLFDGFINQPPQNLRATT